MVRKESFFTKLFFLYGIISTAIISNCNGFNCPLPDGCRLEKVYFRRSIDFNEKGKSKKSAIVCDVKSEMFEFKYNHSNQHNTNNTICDLNPETYEHRQATIFRWLSNDESAILGKKFNFTNAINYFRKFRYPIDLNIYGVNGFDFNILHKNFNSTKTNIENIELIDARLEFYHDKKKINSCQEILDLKIKLVKSIFQIPIDKRSKNDKVFILRDVEYKSKICPLVFQNADIEFILLYGLVNSFYKKSVLKFEDYNSTTTLNSKIKTIQLNNVHGLDLDLNFLNPLVFNATKTMNINSGSLNTINEEMFKILKKLVNFQLNPSIFRKINHKQGIKWIRNINHNVNVDLNDFNKKKLKLVVSKHILFVEDIHFRKRMSKILPEEDFCIYVDFPFNQFVIFVDKNSVNIEYKNVTELLKKEYYCTYLWLIQYSEFYYKFFSQLHHNEFGIFYFSTIINSTWFKSILKCDFEQKKSLCNKSNYQVKDIWDESDSFILNKKMQIVFKISLYPIAFLCLFTNLIVVVVILNKENKDLFKQNKQFPFLCLNSVFCIVISVIEILSWMTECFYPFEVFCPEIRKLAAIQFFKIIFKECFVTMLRFMCNFTYIAFALNRISLIGKDHGKIVTFMSEVGIKKYIGLSFFISGLFSWIKGFKYEVNYFYPASSFPLSNEMNILSNEGIPFNDFYFIYNSISDIVNYVVFVSICVTIDICMVVQLRRILNERTKKTESMIKNQSQAKKSENEEAVNKAIKMVVFNSAIGILFKLPVSFVPLINVVAEFYYKSNLSLILHPSFHEFYLDFYNSGLNILLQDLSGFFYTLSLSIQMFIYKRFDKKFQTGFDRLQEKIFISVKNFFKRCS